MRKHRSDFTKRNDAPGEVWFDVKHDHDLIVASFAAQYGIRLDQEAETITYAEWARLLNGLLPDTPLGRIISVRSEKNREKIKHFTAYERNIQREWNAWKAANIKQEVAKLDLKQLQSMLQRMFASGG